VVTGRSRSTDGPTGAGLSVAIQNSTRLAGGRMLFSWGSDKADRDGPRPDGTYMESRPAPQIRRL